jgi:hypothetical protein
MLGDLGAALIVFAMVHVVTVVTLAAGGGRWCAVLESV